MRPIRRHELAALRRSASATGLTRDLQVELVDRLDIMWADRDAVAAVLEDLRVPWAQVRQVLGRLHRLVTVPEADESGCETGAVVELNRFTYLGFYLVQLLDAGAVEPVGDAVAFLQAGEVIDWIEDRYPFPQTDLSLLVDEERAEANELLSDIAAAYGPAKWGTTTNGLAYVLALVLEAIQRTAKGRTIG